MNDKKEQKIDDLLKNYPNLKKFDEFYKDQKNIKKLNIFYKKPNVDLLNCQIDFDQFDKKYNLNKYSHKNEKEEPKNVLKELNVSKKYDFDKISKDDLNYYFTLVNHYHQKIYGGNIFVKGVNGPIEKALDLLKQCQYNTRLALAKILFPVMDRMGGLSEFENPSLIIPQAMDSRVNLNEKKMEIEEEKKNNNNMKENIVSKEDEIKKNIKINNELVNIQKKLIKNSPSIYLSFALNDLIGADKAQKEKWLQYIIDQVNNKVEYKYLKTLIEISNKMKLDLPDNIMKEKSNSETLSNKIKKILENKEYDLDNLKSLYDIAETQRVQTEEFKNLKEIIKRGEEWEEKVNYIKEKCIEYDELKSLYNEANILPFELNEDLYNHINDRYTRSQKWMELYSELLKMSKVKSSNKSNNENKTENSLNLLEKMIKTANEVLKITSPEVKLLIENYNYLKETEKEIREILNEPNKEITKDMLKTFLNKLNESKFTIELHDEIEDRLNIMEWRENIREYINNNNRSEEIDKNNESEISKIFGIKHKIILKNKVFKFLIKEAESKKLLNYEDVKAFVDNDKVVEEWIEKIEPIFYNDKQREKISAKNLLKEITNSNYCLKFDDFLKYYEEGQNLILINEECEELLNKCKDIKDLYDEIKVSLNDNQSILDFNKLKLFGDRISQYNIICNEFDNALKELNLGQEWQENAKKFCDEYTKANNNKFTFYYLCENINDENENIAIDYDKIDPKLFNQYRNDNMKIIEKYLKENKIFFDDLLKLTKNVPSYLKNTGESTNLSNFQLLSELSMNKHIQLNSAEQILSYIEKTQGICISKENIKNWFNMYKIKTWNQAVKLKLYLPNAESLLTEVESLQKIKQNDIVTETINMEDVQNLYNKVNITKEWVNKTKQFLSKKEKTISDLIARAEESKHLPLTSKAIDEFIKFKNDIENNINEIKKIKNEKKDFKFIEELYKKFGNNKFTDCEEYLFIKSLYDFGIKWTENAKKIINSRQLCQLYFKNKIPLEDGTIIENNENPDKNKLIYPNIENNNVSKSEPLVFREQNLNNIINESTVKSNRFILGENQFLNNNLSNFLSRKRSHDNTNNNNTNNNNNVNDIDNAYPNNSNNDIHNKTINQDDYKPNNNDMEENKALIIDRNNTISLKEINISNNTLKTNENNAEKEVNEKDNIINDSTEIEYHQSDNVKKYYLNQPLQKDECANLLSLINNKEYLPLIPQTESNNSKLNYYTRSHSVMQTHNNNGNNNLNNNNQKMGLIEEPQITQEQIQKFIDMNYYQRYNYLRSNLIFHDDNKEEYCICRKGDDSVNYMIICEKCKEWFHGKCLGMPKSVADKISNYYCLCCTRKYDLPKEYYHKQFFEIKRISMNDLILMIEEGKKANCFFEEIEILEDIKIRAEIWNKKYYKLLEEVTAYYNKKNVDCLNEELEKKLEIIYLESEAIQIELNTFLHPIIFLKHNEWFKGVNKELNSNKNNEENIKNYIKNSYFIFNLNVKNYITKPKLEENYYNRIYQLADYKLNILFDVYNIIHQNDGEDNSISTKEKNKRK